METKFTPGPWHVCEQNPHKVMAAFGPENGTSINADYYADLLEVVHGQPRTYYSSEESQANARLIAASPDLLDGCNALLGLITLICSRPDMPAEIAEALKTSHRTMEARAAVEKATGAA